jgi:hypothetical protein
MGGTDGQQAAQLAVGAGLGAQGHGRHASQGLQPMGQAVHQLDRALHRRLRLQRVDVGEARQARHLLVQARVVLHRARAQRIQRQVDGVVLLAQAHVVAHGFRLGQARQADRRGADQVAQIIGWRGVRQVDAGLVPGVQFEDQRLVLQQAAGPGQGRVDVVVGVRLGRLQDGSGVRRNSCSLCQHLGQGLGEEGDVDVGRGLGGGRPAGRRRGRRSGRGARTARRR